VEESIDELNPDQIDVTKEEAREDPEERRAEDGLAEGFDQMQRIIAEK
jgi:hypothetical protein